MCPLRVVSLKLERFSIQVGELHAAPGAEGEQRCVCYAISAHACVLRIGGVCYLYSFSAISLRYPGYLALGLEFALCYMLSLCYLCALYATLCWGLVFALCYLCYLMLSLCHLWAIPLIFLWNISLYSLLSLSKAFVLEFDVRNSQFQICWCPETVDPSMFCVLGGHGMIRGLYTEFGLATV